MSALVKAEVFIRVRLVRMFRHMGKRDIRRYQRRVMRRDQPKPGVPVVTVEITPETVWGAQ